MISHNLYYVKFAMGCVCQLRILGLATSEVRNFSHETRKHCGFISENLEQSRPKILNFEISSPHDQPEARKPCAFSPPRMDQT